LFWDRVAPLYDLAVNALNRRVYDGTGGAVARLIRPGDTVLECACRTGAISAAIAPACARVVATDYSEGMLKQARKKLAKHSNVTVEQADITDLRYANDSFDAAVAGHRLPLPPPPPRARLSAASPGSRPGRPCPRCSSSLPGRLPDGRCEPRSRSSRSAQEQPLSACFTGSD